jgi:hypothetical protein
MPKPKLNTQNLIIFAIGVWLAYQVLMPLRHVLYAGNVSWTEEGHKYAWQMKLRDKRGYAIFYVRDPETDKTWEIYPRAFLTGRQTRKMSTRPEMILQFAHYLAGIWKSKYNVSEPEVRVVARVSLNGRNPALMIDPEVDLCMVERSLKRADWILPLNEPFIRDPSQYRS